LLQAAISLVSSSNPANLGSPVTLTAVVTPAPTSGSVTFYDGTSILAIQPLVNGRASITTTLLPAGTRSLKAYSGGDSAALTQAIKAQPANSLLPSVNYGINTPGFPALAIADFNGDGKPDILTNADVNGNFNILPGNGNGTFQNPLRFSINGVNLAMAVADFNGDGIPDIATGGAVLLGKGDGTLQPPIAFKTNLVPYFMAAADFNGDGKADLVIAANTSAAQTSVLLGNGDGTFQAPQTIAIASGPIAVDDFNGDGKPDIVVSNRILLGNGDGTFQSANNYGFSDAPTSIAIGDFNGDGKADIAVASPSIGIGVLLGNGNGTFQPPLPISANQGMLSVGDINGDGNDDVVSVANSTASVFLGNGDGHFHFSISYYGPLASAPAAIADLNGDGKSDLAVVRGGSVGIMLGASLQPTTTTLSSSRNPTFYLQGGLLTASVSPSSATGSLTFYNENLPAQTSSVVNGQATFILGSIAIGLHSFSAFYSGDNTYAASGSEVLLEEVDPIPTSTTLSSTMNPTTAGRNVTLVATVSATVGAPPSPGMVTFSNGSTVIGTSSVVNGRASLTTSFSSGTYSLTAMYSGTVTYIPSVSPAFVEVVGGPPAPSSTTLTSSSNSPGFGQPVTLTATISPATAIPQLLGKVTFYDGGTVLGSAPIGMNRSTITTSLLSTGAHSLKAYYAGDMTYGPSTSPPISVRVNSQPANGFTAPVSYPIRLFPSSIAVGDFNGDGHPDLVTAAGSSITVMLGNGDGSFQLPVLYNAGAPTQMVVVADFNGDGKMDLATGSSILLGNGDGTFQTPQVLILGGSSFQTAVADFDGDGLPDLAAAIVGPAVLSISLGNGDGTFQAPTTYPLSGISNGLITGDFNGDGITDIASASTSGGLSVFLGKGDGTFSPVTMFPCGLNCGSIAAGDFNGDGKIDLVVTDAAGNISSNVNVLIGNGDGSFQKPVSYAVQQNPFNVAVADVDGDGNADLITVNSIGSVSILPGNGDGTFRPAVNTIVSPNLHGLAVGDFNGDGKVDIAVGSAVSSIIMVMLGKLAAVTDVTLTSSANPSAYGRNVTLTATVPAPNATGSVVFYDGIAILGSARLKNGQGTLTTNLLNAGNHALHAYYTGDINTNANTSAVFNQTIGAPNSPANSLQSPVNYSTGPDPRSVVVADFNQDGKPDLAIANFGSSLGDGSIGIAFGNGDGSFRAPVGYPAAGGPISLAVGDFNGDGIVDLVVANNVANNVSVLLGNGDGTFQAPLKFTTGLGPTSVVAADFNGDGVSDLAVANYGGPFNASVSVLLGNGDGTFRTATSFFGGVALRALATGDFNGDGIVDLAIASGIGVGVAIGKGDGTFSNTSLIGSGLLVDSVTVADFNGDGKADIASLQINGTSVFVSLGNGDGTFKNQIAYPAGTNTFALVAGDFNADGIPDLAVANYGAATGAGGGLSILLGNGDGTFQPGVNYPAGVNPTGIASGDFNGDGEIDLVLCDQGNTFNVYLGNLSPLPRVTLSSSPNPAVTGQLVTLTATVSPADTAGTVTFFDGPALLGSNPVTAGKSALSVRFNTIAVHSIQARFTGGPSFVASVSPVLAQTISGGLLGSSIKLTSSVNPSIFGQPITLTANVSPADASGIVTFYDNVTVLGTGAIVNGQASFTTALLSPGAHSLKANYSGDAGHTVSTALGINETINAQLWSGFQPAISFATGPNPLHAVSGDFNGDGITDIAVANSGDNTVSILLGNGDGTFQTSVPYPTGAYPSFVAVGDFNGDGKSDLVVANNTGNSVSVLLGNGDGSFQPPWNFAVGSGPVSIAVGDFNSDGIADLAVLNQLSSTLSVLQGNGDGSFRTPVNYPAGVRPSSIVAGRVIGISATDLFVADYFEGFMLVYPGMGDGTFAHSIAFPLGFPSGPLSFATADFNGDGLSDIAIADYEGRVRVANSDQTRGNFRTIGSYSTGVKCWSVTVSDLDGDGKLDIIAVNEGENTISVLSGKGDGTFQPAVNYPVTGANPISVVPGDFNGDGIVDLAILNYGDNNISVVLGK
jgi:hypothetical protein